MSCILFGNPNQMFSDSDLQPTDIVETSSNGGLGDVGPPHQNIEGKK